MIVYGQDKCGLVICDNFFETWEKRTNKFSLEVVLSVCHHEKSFVCILNGLGYWQCNTLGLLTLNKCIFLDSFDRKTYYFQVVSVNGNYAENSYQNFYDPSKSATSESDSYNAKTIEIRYGSGTTIIEKTKDYAGIGSQFRTKNKIV